MKPSNTHTLGFIGGGQMATALSTGAVHSGLVAEERLVFFDTSLEAQAKLREKFPAAKIAHHLNELCSSCDSIVLAVKPQVLVKIANEISRALCPKNLIISVAAGISLAKLETLLGSPRIVRVMPNTPCQVQAGASGIAALPGATAEDRNWVEHLMASVGTVHHVDDDLLHAVTGVSGSGPAYAFLVIEALADGGVAVGLPRKIALQLAAQTLLGAATMVLKTGEHPGELKDRVASPGGTTIAAIAELEKHGVRAAFIEAVKAATERSKSLGGT
jgi:pyrroline-5-carboxylate reductase